MMKYADLESKSPSHVNAKPASMARCSSPAPQPRTVFQRAPMTGAGAHVLQAMVGNRAVGQLLQGEQDSDPRPESGPTALPSQLRSGIEQMSGVDMSDVKVHANSQKPSQVGALAYTSGSDIYVQPGQERHLPHEAWHAVQQKTGRVQPTTQLAGVAINDDSSLEKEADVMGARALQGKFDEPVHQFEEDEGDEMVQTKMDKSGGLGVKAYTD